MTFLEGLYLVVGYLMGWFLGPALYDLYQKIREEIKNTQWHR